MTIRTIMGWPRAFGHASSSPCPCTPKPLLRREDHYEWYHVISSCLIQPWWESPMHMFPYLSVKPSMMIHVFALFSSNLTNMEGTCSDNSKDSKERKLRWLKDSAPARCAGQLGGNWSKPAGDAGNKPGAIKPWEVRLKFTQIRSNKETPRCEAQEKNRQNCTSSKC